MEPEVTKLGLFDMQVCVPQSWTDSEVVRFAETTAPCGTVEGWTITRADDAVLAGDPERAECSRRPGFVHIMLHA